MRKKFLLLLICSFSLLLGGCGDAKYGDIYLDSHNVLQDMMRIDVDDEYKFKDFQKEYTEDGCIVTLYYEKTD